MGRAGAGRGGGGGHSSGGHSSSRSSGGHRTGSSRPSYHSSSRAGGSSWSSSRHTRYGGYNSRRVVNNYYGYRGSGGRLSGIIITVVILLVFACIVFGSIGSPISKSTYNREPLTGTTFFNDCVVDELDWTDNLSKTQRDLRNFWKKTGVQPFVYLKDYDSSLTTDEEKVAYAEQYYETQFGANENIFLMIYFAEEDTDNDVGYMAHVCGHNAGSVMDAEAIDIFYSYWDSNWYSDKSTDAVIVDSFDSTAKRIMSKSTTFADVLKFAVIGVIVLGLARFGIYRLKLKQKRAAEEAKETEAILNTPLEHLHSDDDL